jgi:2Fe-2S ferredoxin
MICHSTVVGIWPLDSVPRRHLHYCAPARRFHRGEVIRMPAVTYISASGESRRIDVPIGTSVMQAALNHKLGGVLGECGGNCMCATCHVYVDPAFLVRIPPAVENEKFMLSIAAEGPAPNSRLSCQIKMTEELDGLIVRLPGKQK